MTFSVGHTKFHEREKETGFQIKSERWLRTENIIIDTGGGHISVPIMH